MYSGTVLDQAFEKVSMWSWFFLQKDLRIFPHGNLLLSRNSSGLSTVKGSFSSFTVITTIATCSGQMCCWLLWIKSELRFPETKGQGQQWIIQDLLCSSPQPGPALVVVRWKHVQICKNKSQREIPNTEACFLRSTSNRCWFKAKKKQKNVRHDDPP